MPCDNQFWKKESCFKIHHQEDGRSDRGMPSSNCYKILESFQVSSRMFIYSYMWEKSSQSWAVELNALSV